jgi:hypothetical protein
MAYHQRYRAYKNLGPSTVSRRHLCKAFQPSREGSHSFLGNVLPLSFQPNNLTHHHHHFGSTKQCRRYRRRSVKMKVLMRLWKRQTFPSSRSTCPRQGQRPITVEIRLVPRPSLATRRPSAKLRKIVKVLLVHGGEGTCISRSNIGTYDG